MPQIKCHNSKHLITVDDEDFERLSQFRWHVMCCRVVKCDGPAELGNDRIIPLSREVMRRYDVMFDHINRDFLDNRKCNLRECNHAQNSANRAKMRNCSSKYKGVNYNWHSGQWKVSLCCNKIKYHLGYFWDEKEAARAYNRKAFELMGEFAVLNKDNNGNIL
jgi:hypothetical protein